ncbi:hypothetical protein BKA70DRAFT_1352820 [Coprinopsis sp. MPI-PUGE-AT-0042]|nr:hypothetical protein BKA70DRAFT_1352820 [Coprinopsis sp. MPI-PUGE-AT-0042]
MMIPDTRLNLYAHINNEPLPEHLKPTLTTFLSHLEQHDQACGHNHQRIEEDIEEKQSIIQALESQIKCLKAVQLRLLTTRATISRRKRLYGTTLSPFRRMPPEIIAKIIEFATSGVYCGFTEAPERHHFRNLRAVCRLWRQTALSTPYLWRAVGIAHYEFPAPSARVIDSSSWDAFAQSFISWFSRGGASAPVKIFLSGGSLDHTMFMFQTMRKSKLNFTSAIISIILKVDQDDGHNNLKFLVPSPTESGATLPLKNISIFLDRPGLRAEGSPRQVLDLTHHLPHLSTFTLSYSQGPTFEPPSFFHKTMTALFLRRIHLPAHEVEFVLEGLPQLKYLILQRCTPLPFEETDVMALPYAHSALQSIEFHHGIPQSFVSRLVCPSLRILVVSGEAPKGQQGQGELAYLQSFVERCGVAVKLNFYDDPPRTLKP